MLVYDESKAAFALFSRQTRFGKACENLKVSHTVVGGRVARRTILLSPLKPSA